MDKKLKTKWVAALRSGKYRQGRNNLKRVNDIPGKPASFCCLGVLKEIKPSIRACRGRNYLSCKPSGIDASTQNKLAEFNDGDGDQSPWGFRRIATWIEKNL